MTSTQFLNFHYPVSTEIKDGIFLDISNNLRNPLTAIQMALDLLSCGQLGTLSKQQHHIVEIAANNAQRLIRLTSASKGDREVVNTVISEKELAQIKFEQDLEKALSRNEFSLCYQPILSLKNNKIIGFEALIRWQHPTLGTISPDTFIPLTETSGAIIKIGKWVLKEACSQLCKWQQEFPEHFASLTVSVNVSSKQLANPDFAAEVQQILQETGLKSQSLVLEITETAIIDNDIQAKETLTKLQNAGIRIYIDDFGMGYSSLSRLYELPLNVIKIDRYFVEKLDCPNGNHIIEAITNMAHNLGLEVIAEGVETSEQILKLQSLGCHQVQGYFLSKPLEKYAIAPFVCGEIQ
ncbi:EAL domain-containing protein [Anabaena sp. UHCC 0204]|uniref:EAL domain-containing protein n=1 Tax=Anabaena sp. UHCC 0204 TaxID=2590009 RepID=UPI0014487AF1|nr:EAL domain-containing protein [Anabaena sp. UHCC 0204]MTJ07316.1 EAL domain-containing protein [Anabaena sp. UHCC 0204]